MNQPAFLAVMMLLAFAAFGWGTALISALSSLGTDTSKQQLAARVNAPLVVTIGIGVILAIGGVGVALDAANFRFIIGMLVVGSVVSAVRIGHSVVGHRLSLPGLRTVAVTGAFTVVVFFAYGAALAGPVNANDDDAAYLYLAQRLLSTGGLIDPFNFRRVTSYGGSEIFQALVLRTGGGGAALGVEWFFFLLLLLALVIRSASRRFAAPIALVFGLGLTVTHPVGIWANSAPTFSGVVLTLAVLQLLAISLRDGPNWRLDVCSGVLIGGLLALRLQFVVPVAVIVAVASIVIRRRQAWKLIGTVALGGVVGVVPWAIALERSSKTLLFPLFAGTDNTAFPWEDPALRTARQFAGRVWNEIWTDALGIELLAVLTVCVLLLHLGRRWDSGRFLNPTITIALAGVAGCLVLVLSETRSFSGGPLSDIGRYNAPSVLGLILFVAGELWTFAERRPTVVIDDNDQAAPANQRRATWPCATMAVLLVVVPLGAVIFSSPPFGPTIHGAGTASYDEAEYAVKRIDGAYGSAGRWAAVQPTYDRMNAVIPQGAKVFAAVAVPGLLDFRRFTFSTLDIAGAASPAPGLPLLKGEPEVVGYLQNLGFDGVVASVTNAPGLDNYKSWSASSTSGIENYRAMSVEFTAWAHILSAMSRDHRIHRTRIGTLVYLSWSTPTD